MSVRFFSSRFFDSFRVFFLSFFSFAWATHNTTWASSYGKWKKHQLKMDWIAGGWKEKRAEHKRQVDDRQTDGQTLRQNWSIIEKGASPRRTSQQRMKWKQINEVKEMFISLRATGERYVGWEASSLIFFLWCETSRIGDPLLWEFNSFEGWMDGRLTRNALAKPWTFLVFLLLLFIISLTSLKSK